VEERSRPWRAGLRPPISLSPEEEIRGRSGFWIPHRRQPGAIVSEGFPGSGGRRLRVTAVRYVSRRPGCSPQSAAARGKALPMAYTAEPCPRICHQTDGVSERLSEVPRLH
jgi:hypothetical protein